MARLQINCFRERTCPFKPDFFTMVYANNWKEVFELVAVIMFLAPPSVLDFRKNSIVLLI